MLRCAPKKSIKKPRKAASGQKEMLMPVECKKQANEMAARKTGPVPSAGLYGAVFWGTRPAVTPLSQVVADEKVTIAGRLGNRVVQRAVA